MTTRWLRVGTAALTGMGLTLALTGLSFAQSSAAVSKTAVKSSAVKIESNLNQPQIITGPHGTITLTPLGQGQWQAVWTWGGLNHADGPLVTLWGWEGVQAGSGKPNIGPFNESTVTYSGDTATIDFTQPGTYPAHPEVVQFSTFLGDLGIGPTSPVGQLPEVPWAAALPLILVAPLAVRALKHRTA